MQVKSILRIATFTLLNISAVLCAYGTSMNPMMAHYADPMFQPVEQNTSYYVSSESTESRVHID